MKFVFLFLVAFLFIAKVAAMPHFSPELIAWLEEGDPTAENDRVARKNSPGEAPKSTTPLPKAAPTKQGAKLL